jgi:hypothetical protein
MANMNPSFGSRGMLPAYVPLFFSGGHIPQVTPTVGGWNPLSFGPNPRFNALGWSAQMCGQFTSYIPSTIPSSSTSILTNDFVMVNPLCPLTFHLEGGIFIIWETPSMEFLHLGEMYIILIMSLPWV